MDRKRGLIGFMLVFAFVILSFNFISSTTCSVVPIASCPAVNTVMKLSATTNAHGEIYSQTHYPYALCCFGMTYYTAADNASMHTCGGSNKVLGLSATTNAHAQIPSLVTYSTNVCFGKLTCDDLPACNTDYPIQMVSLSATTNAHLAQFSTYTTKICCKDTGAVCGNGAVEEGEDCDDSNRNNGDCCDSNCQYEAAGSSCTSDSNACTTDVCNAVGTCLHNAINCNDGNLCTTDSCNAATGCVNTPMNCNDGNACTIDSCSGGVCSNVPMNCNDGNACTIDSCSGGVCSNVPMNCNDGNVCTTDICSAGVCNHIVNLGCCTQNSQCNDNNACTAPDTCNLLTNSCSNPVLSCGTNNDGCCPSGCYSGDDNDCTICGDNGDCDDGNPCTTNICSGGSCTYPIISPPCVNNDGCCLGSASGCYATNDNNCPALCGNGVRENPPELCDGSQLGGATCDSILGTTGYTGTPSCYPAGHVDQCEYNTVGCVPPCVLSDADWSISTPVGGPYMVEGTSVLLNIVGTNCGGKAVSFEIREKDALGGDDAVSINPVNILFPAGGIASGSWTAEWQPEGWPESDPPEYYFIATVGGSQVIRSPDSNVNDAGLLRVSELVTCGNGAIDPPLENCDDGAALNGVACTPAYGSSCTYCSSGCTTTTVDGAYCGDTTCDTGNEDCSSCPADCGVCPSTCTILNAYWNVTSVIANGRVRLNVEASNCGGETVTFEVFEDDGSFGDDDITTATPAGTNPSSINFPSSGNLGFVDWNAFYMEDNEIGQSYPPEFYFTATILSEEMDSTNLLEVLNAGACAGINLCSDYTDVDMCNEDTCTAGDNEPTCNEGSVYDPLTRCTITSECDCYWNTNTATCEPETIFSDPVCSTYSCDSSVDECWLAGDACQINANSCTCEDGYNPNALGYCVPAHVCDPLTDICWLQGDLCTDECICETGYTSNGDGTCGSSNPNVCDPATDDCWLMGDKCQYDCTCENGYTPNGLGYCDPANVCDSSDECWILGDGCLDDCTCINNDPDGVGGCNSGTTGGDLKIGVCKYTTTGTDTCTEGVASIERTTTGVMDWDISNEYLITEIPVWGIINTNFMEDPLVLGTYRYYSPTQYTECITPVTQSIRCPAMVELPFFEVYQIVIVIGIVGLIYLVYFLKYKDSKKSKSAKKSKKRK